MMTISGLWVSPDIEYADFISKVIQDWWQQGLGPKHETHQVLEELKLWARHLDDLKALDLATHTYRNQSEALKVFSASEITQRLAKRHGVTLRFCANPTDVWKLE